MIFPLVCVTVPFVDPSVNAEPKVVVPTPLLMLNGLSITTPFPVKV